MLSLAKNNMENRQSAAKFLNINIHGKGSTTIPRKGSSLKNLLSEKPDIIFYNLFKKTKFKNSCIYTILTLHNNKLYVGSTKNITDRMNRHCNTLSTKSHYNKYLQRVFNKYGKENCYFAILEEVNFYSDFDKIEEKWIKFLNTVDKGYNCTYNTFRNLISKEVIERNVKRTSKKVVCLNMAGKYVCTFSSISEASRFFNTSSSNISRCCMGKFYHIKNHIFVHETDYNPEKDYKFVGRDFSYRKEKEYRENMSRSLKKAKSLHKKNNAIAEI